MVNMIIKITLNQSINLHIFLLVTSVCNCILFTWRDLKWNSSSNKILLQIILIFPSYYFFYRCTGNIRRNVRYRQVNMKLLVFGHKQRATALTKNKKKKLKKNKKKKRSQKTQNRNYRKMYKPHLGRLKKLRTSNHLQHW